MWRLPFICVVVILMAVFVWWRYDDTYPPREKPGVLLGCLVWYIMYTLACSLGGVVLFGLYQVVTLLWGLLS